MCVDRIDWDAIVGEMETKNRIYQLWELNKVSGFNEYWNTMKSCGLCKKSIHQFYIVHLQLDIPSHILC